MVSFCFLFIFLHKYLLLNTPQPWHVFSSASLSSSVPASACVLHRPQSIPALMSFTHGHCPLKGISLHHGESPSKVVNPFLDSCSFLKMFWSVSQPYGTFWNWHRTVCCLFPHSSSQQQPDTKTLPLIHNIRRQNISIMEYTPSPRRKHDAFSCRLGELGKELEWWQNLVSVETLRLWTDRLFTK